MKIKSHKTSIKIMLLLLFFVLILSFTAQTVSNNCINKIQTYELYLIHQYSNDETLITGVEREEFLNEMESYLIENRHSLLLNKIYRYPDSISVVLYTGVHYLVYPQTKDEK